MMNRPPRHRLLILMLAGVSLMGVTWLLGRDPRKGEGYYFPTWRLGEFSEQQYWKRYGKLTNVSQNLPIVLRAMERHPSKLGEKWEDLRGEVPEQWRRRLPQYLGPNWAAASWLAQHATDREVAAKVVERWDRMWQGTRNDWLGTVGPNQVSQRPEYLPLLRKLAGDLDPEIALSAAYLLTGYRPISETDSMVVRKAMMAGGSRVSLRLHLLLSWQIGLQPMPSPSLVQALQAWSDSTNRTSAIAGALGLVMVDPAKFPPGELLEPRWRKLPRAEAREVLEMTRRAGFEGLMLSEWAVAFFGALLAVPTNQITPATFESTPPKDFILWSYRQFGTNAAGLAPALVPLFSAEGLENASAGAFASIAGPDASLVPLVAPALTNADAAGPLLLWLTSIGPRALAARDEVRRLAQDGVRFPPAALKGSPMRLDPVLAKRYGLPAPAPKDPDRKVREPSPRKPSEIRVKAQDVCPWPLAAIWPGSALGLGKPDSGRLSDLDRAFLIGLRESTLGELAQRCLAAMESDKLPQPAVRADVSEPK
jgi:Txe/YoeB family toxin of Txe-Axe toxin-antitoxin module